MKIPKTPHPTPHTLHPTPHTLPPGKPFSADPTYVFPSHHH
ncbi:hypothetical protein [Microcystis sp. M169S2]|nr:hypothetical protein [Microcystis sp. M169S2]